MQCKDVPDFPILKFLADLNGTWANWWCNDDKDVRRVFPPGVPDKIVLAKMGRLIRRKLVDGCACGCRGDFVITETGRSYVEQLETKGVQR